MHYRLAALILCSLLLSVNCVAQVPQQKDQVPPATKLEAFSAKTGTVIIEGFSTVGTLNGMGSVSVDAKEFRDASNPQMRASGLTIEVKESGRFEKQNRSFVDYDEIDSLIQGLDYISKISPSVTSMKNFQADYKTKGDFSVSTFNEHNGAIGVAVNSGRFGPATAFFKLSDLSQLRAIIVSGKAAIDAAAHK